MLYSGASWVAQTGNNLPAVQETWVQSLGSEALLDKGMAAHSSIIFLPGEFHGQRSLVGSSPRDRKARDMTEGT